MQQQIKALSKSSQECFNQLAELDFNEIQDNDKACHLINQLQVKIDSFYYSISSEPIQDSQGSQLDPIEELEEKLKAKEKEVNALKQKLSDLAGSNLNNNYLTFLKLSEKKMSHKNMQIGPFEAIFKDEGIQQKSLEIEKKKLKIEELASHAIEEEDSKIVGNSTFLALKSPTSYMIGTYRKRIKLIEDNQIIFSEKLSNKFSRLKDIIYIDSLDCYLLSHDKQIFIKNIDDKPPETYLEIETCYRLGGSFVYSQRHQRLLVNTKRSIISVIDLLTKEIEIQVKMTNAVQINNFKLFGEYQDKVVSITPDGLIFLHQFNYIQRTGTEVCHAQETLDQSNEYGASIAVCEKGRYILVEIGMNWRIGTNSCSKMSVYKIIANSLVKQSTIDMRCFGIGEKYALECYGYVGSHLVWVGASKGREGILQVFEYSTKDEELMELKEKRVSHLELEPPKFQRFGQYLYFTGEKRKVLRVSFQK